MNACIPLKQSLLVASCALILTACGGGGSSSPVPVTPTPASQASGSSTAPTVQAVNKKTENTATNTKASAEQPKQDGKQVVDNTEKTNATPSIKTESKPVSAKGGFDAEFSKALQKGFATMKRGTYTGVTLTIDNNEKTVTGVTNKNEKFEDFTLNGAKILLLERVNDKLSYVPVRKLVEADFRSSFAPKDVSNAGWLGSRLGNQSELASFGELRYGVYTDANNKTHLFVHGNPASRVFAGEYLGSVIMGKDGVYQGLPNSVKATVSKDLTKLNVSIDTGSDTLNFGGNIAGNTFSGTQNGVETKGGFFGDGLGGIFQVTEGTHKDKNGVFGAAKKTKELSDMF